MIPVRQAIVLCVLGPSAPSLRLGLGALEEGPRTPCKGEGFIAGEPGY
jgi:hypothetical protein